MTDGQILKAYVRNHPKNQVTIARELAISKQTLVQYFESRKITQEVKNKLESYFEEPIFNEKRISPDPANTHKKYDKHTGIMTASKAIELLESQLKRQSEREIKQDERYDTLMKMYQTLMEMYQDLSKKLDLLSEKMEEVKKNSSGGGKAEPIWTSDLGKVD